MRAIPLTEAGQRVGALLLLRDVSELRRRERELITKDATIREIHHRVKNNLQTVAALLRLQARRLDEPQARAALEESVRRVASIAMVHETLSLALDESVRFDGIADRVLAMCAEVAAPESAVAVVRRGEFGVLAADVATPLAMVLTELVQNAVEHAAASRIEVDVERTSETLTVVVRDDGQGLPAGFAFAESDRLGLKIVRTLVEGELRGTLLRTPRGSNGFGYDPIFVVEGDTRTLAEYTDVEKNAISHRGRAFRALASRGLGILGRPSFRHSAAQAWLKPPEELREFLSRWLAATETTQLTRSATY